MEKEASNRITDSYFVALEERVDELINLCEQLTQENRSLQSRQDELLEERDTLIAQNEQSRTRIEAMVARLKGLEQST